MIITHGSPELRGTDVYTDDSNIAMAAVHAGLVKVGERAIITLTIVESPSEYQGSTRNGVTSRDYGSYLNSSFILQRKTEEPTGRQRADNDPTGPFAAINYLRINYPNIDYSPSLDPAVNGVNRFLQRRQRSE